MRFGVVPQDYPRCQVTLSLRLEGYYISTPIVQRQVNTDKESFCGASFIPVVEGAFLLRDKIF